MKKGEEYESIITRVDFPNKGVCTVGDHEVSVKNTLPGQKIKFRISKKKAGKIEGRLLEVIEKSSMECVESDCPAFGQCGSCMYREISYEDQKSIKEAQIRRLLSNATGDAEMPWFEGVKSSPIQNEYRNKMEFSFGDAYKDGPLTLGMHKRGSFYDVVSAEWCQITDEDFRVLVRVVQDFCSEGGWPYYRKDHTGFLRSLLVRKAAKTGQILVDIVTSTQTPDDWSDAAFAEAILKVEEAGGFDGKITGILHTWNDRMADVIEDQGTDIIYGRNWIEEEVLGLKFQITPFSFFQTNTLGTEVLYDQAREYVRHALKGKTAGTVFDLYSGTGTISQLIAPAADKVIGVEIIEEAVEAAKVNAKANGLENCEFHCGDVLKVIDDITDRADLIILDPPRDGVHPKALPKILAYEAENLVYISCKPTSLARDLGPIMAAGYRIVRGACVDMFPGTGHVETVVLLSGLR